MEPGTGSPVPQKIAGWGLGGSCLQEGVEGWMSICPQGISSALSWLMVARKHLDVDELLEEMQFCEAGRAWSCCLMRNLSPLRAGPRATKSLSQSLALVTGHSALSQTSPQESWNWLVIPVVSHPSFPHQPAINSYSRLEVASQFLLLFTVVYLQGFDLLHFLM